MSLMVYSEKDIEKEVYGIEGSIIRTLDGSMGSNIIFKNTWLVKIFEDTLLATKECLKMNQIINGFKNDIKTLKSISLKYVNLNVEELLKDIKYFDEKIFNSSSLQEDMGYTDNYITDIMVSIEDILSIEYSVKNINMITIEKSNTIRVITK